MSNLFGIPLRLQLMLLLLLLVFGMMMMMAMIAQNGRERGHCGVCRTAKEWPPWRRGGTSRQRRQLPPLRPRGHTIRRSSAIHTAPGASLSATAVLFANAVY